MLDIIDVIDKVLAPLERYHRYEVRGLEGLPTGPFMLAVSHSFATYDSFLLGREIYRRTGRLPMGLGDDMLFRLPGIGSAARDLGIVPASPTAGAEILRSGRILMLAPGGMREALRPASDRHRVIWRRRRGFVRLALKEGVPLVLSACARADDIYRLYQNPLTAGIYERFKAPLPLFRGRGPSLLPRRVPLRQLVSEPIHPPVYEPQREQEQVDALHARVCDRMDALMAESLA